MNDEETGGAAFPRFVPEGHYNGSVDVKGMTLRDYFAAKAMEAICANPTTKGTHPEEIAWAAYSMADAMLEERKS